MCSTARHLSRGAATVCCHRRDFALPPKLADARCYRSCDASSPSAPRGGGHVKRFRDVASGQVLLCDCHRSSQAKKVIYAGQSAGDAAGDYTVGKKNIVSLYNKHLSGMVEAKYIPFMDALNVAYQTGRYDDARARISRRRRTPCQGVPTTRWSHMRMYSRRSSWRRLGRRRPASGAASEYEWAAGDHEGRREHEGDGGQRVPHGHRAVPFLGERRDERRRPIDGSAPIGR